MKLLKRLIAVVVLTSLTLAFAEEAAQQADDPVVIQLGERALTRNEFNERFELAARLVAARRGTRFDTDSQALFEAVRPQLVAQLVTQMVLLEEAEARGLEVTDEDIDAELEFLESEFELEDDAALEDFFTGLGFTTQEEFRDYIRDNELVRRVIEELRAGIEIVNEEVVDYYDANRDLFERPLEEVRDQVIQRLEGEKLREMLNGLVEASGAEVFPEHLELEEGIGEEGVGE